jgi:hypothetical protein
MIPAVSTLGPGTLITRDLTYGIMACIQLAITTKAWISFPSQLTP